MYILGISAFYHDSAAVLLKDGQIVIALEEERFSRVKHDNSFPRRAIKKCLDFAEIDISEVGHVVYYEKPLLKFERILQNFVETFPFSWRLFLKAIPEWLGEKIKVEAIIRKKLGYKKKIYYIPHHLSHAAAAFYTSGYKSSAIVTIDGVGEYQTTGIWLGSELEIKKIKGLVYPHSLGLLYSTFTAFLGFRVNEGEYKMMGLSAYGEARYFEEVKKLIDLKEDGSFFLRLEYFGFRDSMKMWSDNFERLFGVPRKEGQPIVQKHKDIAASIQKLTEEVYSRILREAKVVTNQVQLCIGGGVALNSLANGKIFESGFDDAYVFGSSGDSGGALGAALFCYYQILKNKRNQTRVESLDLGTVYASTEIEKILRREKLAYKRFEKKEMDSYVAKLLMRDKIIGWFQGRMEFGPRALGYRSILASPISKDIRVRLNKLKRRELFRPFGCSILEEDFFRTFKVKVKSSFPFMNFCFDMKRKYRDLLPAICHEDGTSRVQTINIRNNRFYSLIREFKRISGVGCLLNTSFNLKGEPIVENPHEAIHLFKKAKLDYLVIDCFIVSSKAVSLTV